MKKIFAVLTLLLAFSINASAQDKNGYDGLDAAAKGKKQAAELSEYLGLNAEMNRNFAMLFEQKFIALDDPNVTPERRAEVARVIDAKIKGTLDGALIDKLEKNPELLKKLLN
jgi:hypothetical protein